MTLQELIEQLAMVDAPDIETRIQRMKAMILCWADSQKRENNIQQASDDVVTAYLLARQLQAQRGNGWIN